MPDAPPPEWFVYIIQASDGSLYTGITTDIGRRWQQHLTGKGGARYFRARDPKRLMYLQGGYSRQSASRREAEIKKLTRRQKQFLMATVGSAPDVPS